MTASLFPEPGEVLPGRNLKAECAAVLIAAGRNFLTAPSAGLRLGFAGIDGDHHNGVSRKAGAREPWHPRGTEMRNNRQVSLICPQETAGVAADLGLAEIRPEWLGANIVVAGVREFSLLPPGTLLMFTGGATLRVEARNAPCGIAGRAVADHAKVADPAGFALAFVKAAAFRRGVVATVERAGRIAAGETIFVRVPEQRPWRG